MAAGDFEALLKECWADRKLTLEERLRLNYIAQMIGLPYDRMFKLENGLLSDILKGFEHRDSVSKQICELSRGFNSMTNGERGGLDKLDTVIDHMYTKKGHFTWMDHLAYMAFARAQDIPMPLAYEYLVRRVENMRNKTNK